VIIRNYQDSDFEQLKIIHERYYKEEFSLNEFMGNFLGLFSAVEDNKIICVGGVRTIAESVMVTDKSFSVRQRRDVLLKMLQTQSFITGRSGYNQLHAFIQDSHWEQQLKDFGFKECKGKAVFIGV
jgi:hypothetical protein